MKRKNDNEPIENSQQEKSTRRIPKRKVAVIFGYCGTGYNGLQIQYKSENTKTIEDELIEAFVKANGISEENKEHVKKVGWSRSGRTDKGVHASRQCIAFKALLEKDEENLRTKTNSFLPPHIHIFGIGRVTKGFNARTRVSYRRYQYLLPLWVFTIQECFYGEEKFVDEKIRFKEFDEKALNYFNNQVLNLYTGTQNYHNFTSRKPYKDPSAWRVMREVKCGEPFEIEGTKVVLITILGQSFMLNQIRRMIAVALYIMRGLNEPEIITELFADKKYDFPLVPGFGLFLDQPLYTHYLEKFGKSHCDLNFPDRKEEIEKFKLDFILKHIINLEKEKNLFKNWLGVLYKYPIQERDLNSQNSIFDENENENENENEKENENENENENEKENEKEKENLN
ncbi:tRNA pseudouridine synthase a [Anaeramoeba ignava]|uniref:tRNA pseudouridine synthase a n=1 Tax=Anaeramoeba ignava TaxID=1746090 RepID=A0A9Q0LB43_ANAIG|nr:tRNA pseudouridine synthase a [Anaeramoeba ignava]